jgi:hypothetical protein
MAFYNIRDLLGHWVKLPPKSRENGMCPHACCKGRRPHPDRFPVLLPAGVLRSASVAELEAHLQKESVGRSGRAVSQVVKELDRRERRTEHREMRSRARGRRDEEYRLYVESEVTAAEAATRGNMLNKRGRARGVDPRSLWSASDATRARYASEELRLWWNDHRIVTKSEFQGERGELRGAQRRRESRLYGVY